MLLDEPAAGLSTAETIALGDALLGIANDELGILLVEHDVSLVFEICDYVYVLDRGRLIAEGTPAEIRRHQDVIAAYLGGGYEAEAVAEGVEVLPEAAQ
jgi:ABC-type branched-subunit amino acid transport system ATPase component